MALKKSPPRPRKVDTLWAATLELKARIEDCKDAYIVLSKCNAETLLGEITRLQRELKEAKREAAHMWHEYNRAKRPLNE